MTFPVVESETTSNEGSDTTSHTVSLPSGISDGDLLISIVITDGGSSGVTTFPAGWTKFVAQTVFNSMNLSIAWRDADGTEGASITVTTSGSEQSAHITYRISGASDPTTTPPEGSTATGLSTTPNPPSLSPSGGSDDYLWIAVGGINDSITISSYPTNYTDGVSINSNTSGGRVASIAARRELNASSEDPGVFTLTTSEGWGSATVSIPSGSAPAGTNMSINIGDSWKDVDALKINIGDAWKDVDAVKQNIGDVWKDVF